MILVKKNQICESIIDCDFDNSNNEITLTL